MCFVQFPEGVFPLDIAIGLVMMPFLVVESQQCWRALNLIIAKQTADFIELVHLESAMKRTFPGFSPEKGLDGLLEVASTLRRRNVGGEGVAWEEGVSGVRPSESMQSGGGRGAASPSSAPVDTSNPAGLPPRPPPSASAASEFALGKVTFGDLAREGVAGIRKVVGDGLSLQSTPYSMTSRRFAEDLGVKRDATKNE